MPSRRQRPVMADVARLAGVSKQTVSRVLNDHPHVSAKTRDVVEAAIRELSYRRDASARALATRRSGILGVLAFDTTLLGPPGAIYGMQQVAREGGYFVSIASVDSTSIDPLQQALDHLYDLAVEGVVVVATTESAAALVAELPDELPVVTVEGPTTVNGDSIGFDQEGSARLATEHLLQLGHRLVHHVSGPPGRLDAARRISGWRSALVAAGISPPDPVEGDWMPQSGYEAGERLLARGDLTAVFAANDQLALGLLHSLRVAGVSVPDEVSVVGFDDLPVSAHSAPPLTTVHHDFIAIGRQSVRMLIERIADPSSLSRRVLIEPTLVVRGSTGPPPSDHV